MLQRGAPQHSSKFKKINNYFYLLCIHFIQFNLEKHWSKPKNQKVFFENFAKEQGFNSRVPDNWYKIPAYTLLCHMVI